MACDHAPSFIAGLACFYNEKAGLYTDGGPQQRPRTQFS
jgi:hypothetical protein